MENEEDSVKKREVKKKRIGGSKGRTRARGAKSREQEGRKRESGEEEAKKRRG